MNQPPDDNFYNDSTENANSPWQQRPNQAPGYPQRPQGGPGNYPPQRPTNQPGPGPQNFPPGQQAFPPQGPMSQPGLGPQNFPPGQQAFSPQRPMSQPGLEPQNFFPGPQNAPTQRPMSQPGLEPQNFPPGQQAFPPQGPMGQPGPGPRSFSPGSQNAPTQRPASNPNWGPQNFTPSGPASNPGLGPQGALQQRPASNPNWGPQNFTPSGPTSNPGLEPQGAPQQGFEGQADRTLGATQSQAWLMPGLAQAPRSFAASELKDPSTSGQPPQRPNFPPPSGPMSQPGFSTTNRPQQDLYATEQAPISTKNAPVGAPVPPWPQVSPPESPAGFAPWQQPAQNAWQQQQQPTPNAWQQPPAPASWPDQGQLPPPSPMQSGKKKPKLGLVIALVVIALVIIAGTGGVFFLRSHGSGPTAGTPTAKGTQTTNGVTPVPSQPGSGGTVTPGGGVGSIGSPLQAGTDWLVTITSVKETNASLIAPNAGNTYLEVNLMLKNVSGKTLTLISILEFTLTSPDGKQRWHETLGDTNIRHTPDGNVTANATLSAQMSYEVPKTQHAFILIFAYGLNNNSSASVSWQLNV